MQQAIATMMEAHWCPVVVGVRCSACWAWSGRERRVISYSSHAGRLRPALDPLEDVDDLDTVWALWHPNHLTMWSRKRDEWINLLFDLMNPDEKPGDLPALQDVE